MRTMAKQMCTTQATRFLLTAALVMSWGVGAVRAGQRPAVGPKAAPTAAKRPARVSASRPARTSTTHKSTTGVTHTASLASGRRDPFKLPEPPVTGKGPGGIPEGAPGGVLPPGARGLLISQLRLEGVVREQVANKMIAVVTNETRRAYFLTENEAVYNGVVSKITPDAIYFKENVLDANGRVTTHEVVKRLGSAPGEGR